MNAVIKIGNLQYLQVLEELLLSRIHLREEKIALVKLPFFNLIALLLTVYTQYTEQTHTSALNLYFIHHFVLLTPVSTINTPPPLSSTDTCRA